MSIVTRGGDRGQTSLAGGERVGKGDPRVEVYGTIDELNSWVGVIRSRLAQDDPLTAALIGIQRDLFRVGGLFSRAAAVFPPGRVAFLEEEITRLEADLPPIRLFVLPGGGETASFCHIARTVTRRAERLAWRLPAPEEAAEGLIYLNRLSDYFFQLARYLNRQEGVAEVPLHPGLRR